MDVSQWYHHLLQTSAENVLWSLAQIPQERLYLAPRANRWPVARLVYHLARYEQRIALPSMQQWLGGPGPRPTVGTPEQGAVQEEQEWCDGEGHAIETLVASFKTIRAEQLALIPQLSVQSWHEERDVIWGQRPLRWVVTKTYQHTLEHTDEILRAYLWWR